MKNIYLIILFFSVSLKVMGDEPVKPAVSSSNPDEPLLKVGSMKGLVNDAQTEQPVEYATIGLYNANDSSLITGTITDGKGRFNLPDIPFGEYYVDIRFIGYQSSRITKIRIDERNPRIELGKVNLNQKSTSLEAVEVVAEQGAMEYKIDKKVLNVSQNIASTGGTAADVLANSPSIQTDIDGNISLRGSSSFTVLIDGKPSILEGNDALQQIPSSSIQKIEIITNPSAKYDPEGTSGIINLVLKKQDLQGANGIFNASYGTQGQLTGDLLLNYRRGKFNIFGGVNYSDRPSPGSGFTESETYTPDTTFYLFSKGDMAWERGGSSIKGGFDYYLNDKNTFTFSGQYGKRKFAMSSLNKYRQFTDPASLDEYYIQDNRFDVDMGYYKIDLNYKRSFSKPGHELMAYIYYGSNDGQTSQGIFQEFTDSNYDILDLSAARSRSSQDIAINDVRFKLDYTLPFTEKSRLETGIQSMWVSGDGLYATEDLDPDKQEWIRRAESVSSLEYRRNIQSAYAMIYGSAGDLFDFQAGLRTEYTDRMIRELTFTEEYSINRWDFYPSLFLSRKFNGDHQLQASVTRRVNRPRSWQLNPTQNYIDPLNIRSGNPELKPEFINSYELNYQKKFGKHFFTSEVYYRKTTEKITRIREVGDDNIMYHTFENLNNDAALGIELMGNIKAFKWWDLMVSSNIYNYSITRFELEGEVQETTTYNIRGNTTFTFKWGTKLQVMPSYNGPSVNAQGSREGFFRTDVGVKHDFFNRKLNLVFRVSDVFGTATYTNTTEGQNFYIYSESSRKSPVFVFSLSYRLNNFKQPQRNGMDVMEFGGY